MNGSCNQVKMKVPILISIVVLCHGQVIIKVPKPDDFGQLIQYNNQDVLGNYEFGYDEGHPSGGSFRKEAGDVYGNKVGSYGLRDADGRIRIVNYVADDFGFRADVQSNEPGVGLQDPASTTFNGKNGIVSGSVVPVVPPVVPGPPAVPVAAVNPAVFPVGVAPPAVPAVLKAAPPPPAPAAVSYTVPALPIAPPVTKLLGPTVKYPAPALQYPIPVSVFPAVTPAVGKIPYPVVAPPQATVALSRYTIPLRSGYSGSPALPAYQVLQYPL